RPFFGVMGVAPLPAMGRISSGPPGIHTGNIDNRDIAAGATLYMPVYAPGALFSVGDAHAAQGQGEVDLTAIETALRGRFQLIVRKDLKLTWPRAETATHWIVMGLNPNLEDAMKMAVRETILFITQRFPKLTREEAYMIASVAVDYHVTQVVDGTKGIHGMIPKIDLHRAAIASRRRSLAQRGRPKTSARFVRFSNRPSGSSTFRLTTTPVSMSLTGSRFSSDSAPRPFHHGDSKTRWNNLSGGLAVNMTAGPSGQTISPHPSSREGHHSTARWSSISSYR